MTTDQTAEAALADEERMEKLRAESLTDLGWMSVIEASRYVRQSSRTILLMIQQGRLGERHKGWERNETWPYKTYISPRALSWLHRQPYKSSGRNQPHARKSKETE